MASPASHDVIVIGLGSMGAATCWHLARRGLRVLGIEQFPLVHDRGSHHGRARMIRRAYFEHPDYVPLIRRAYDLWDELEAETGRRSLHRTGGLYLGSADGDIVSGSRRAAEIHDLPHECLDAGQLRDRYPAFHLDPETVGFFEPDAGYLVPETAVRCFLDAAAGHGAELHSEEPVLDWQVEGRGDGPRQVVVTSDRGHYRADSLVITAGAWTTPLLAASPGLNLDLGLRVTRQVQAWFQPRQPKAFADGDPPFPCWFVETDRPYGHYGFPPDPDTGALKVAVHRPGETTHPDSVDRRVSTAEGEALAGFLRRHLPAAAGIQYDAGVCLYTNSRDGHFVVDTVPGQPQVVVGCGFSGHGFKFSSVIGEALADLASRGRSDLPIDFLGLARLR